MYIGMSRRNRMDACSPLIYIGERERERERERVREREREKEIGIERELSAEIETAMVSPDGNHFEFKFYYR